MEIMLLGTSALLVMKQLSKEHRTLIVQFYLKSGSVILTQRRFRNHFKTREAPTPKTIQRLTEKFLAVGSIHNQNTGKSGRKRTSRHQESIRKVAERVSETPKVSVRRLASQVGLSKSSTHRVLKRDLDLTAYKLTVSQKLTADDFGKREAFCRWFLQKCVDSPSFLNGVWWSDEAHFHLNGQVNRQNYRFWGQHPPQEVLEAPLHSPKVTVWCALSAQGIIGPIFLENAAGETVTVNSQRYLAVLKRFYRTLAIKCADTLNEQWLQQHGATAHTSCANLAWLNDRFGGRLISRRSAVNWPAHSPDLTPLDFFLWGYLKSVVYQEVPESLAALKQAIRAAIRAIPLATCARVAEETRRRASRCAAQKGKHFEHVRP